MPTGADEPVVGILEHEWDGIVSLALELGDGEWEMPSECPGWAVRDVMAHMIGTERTLLGDAPPPLPAPIPPHVRNDVGARNEAWVLSRRSRPAREVVEEFRAVTTRRLEDMRSWPAERFDELGPSPVGEVPYREFMNVRVMDCWIHEQDIRVATARPGHDTGPAAQLALTRLASAMPFVVAKQAGAPDGAVVRFQLRGATERRIDVAVRDGRGKAVTDNQGEPDAVLGMDQDVFWRLASGRVTGPAARAAGLVDMRGDVGLGARVVDAMAFMI